MHQHTIFLVAAIGVVTIAGPVSGQTCLGHPAGRGWHGPAALLQRTQGLRRLGTTGSWQSRSGAIVAVQVTADRHTDAQVTGYTLGIRAGPEVRSTEGPPLSLCPVLGAEISLAQDFRWVEVPVGLAMGTAVPLRKPPLDPPPGESLWGAVPSLVLRVSTVLLLDEGSVHGTRQSSQDLGVELGIGMVLPHVYLGAATVIRTAYQGIDTFFLGIPLGHAR